MKRKELSIINVTGFRPCIDLHRGRVKQIVGSTLTDKTNDENLVTNFESEKSSKEFALLYKNDKLRGGHIIKLGPGNDEAALAALEAYPGGMQVGGGIKPDNALKYLDAGASHVIVTSYVFHNGQIDFDRLDELEKVVGKDRLVLDLSCRSKPGSDSYFVVTDRWQKYTDLEISPENLQKLANYCVEFLVHGVDVEGMRIGIMEDLVEKLGEWSPIPVTYAGGARSLADLELVKKLGKGKVDITVGSALDIFGGDLSYEKVVQWHDSQHKDSDDEYERSLAMAAEAALAAAFASEKAIEVAEKTKQSYNVLKSLPCQQTRLKSV
uniref:1-(5-phosphoribosyl)-5-[(5-phosphoribosylamino)methylideneamino]imidazole-4-carboxamideisomerase n=1 Tax=Aplanochytrium stocchinoi TaxID=215587 RepID=A0A7S3PKW7_9STRA|mmetsp:Transcript_3756/g.4418  ORF Transcript_3756/g.4418 Transcript_3756/m.4418 type:complete len:324 (+) Transcript_3756:112-1083(+)